MIPHSIEFYQSVIKVIEYFDEGNRAISNQKGNELSGNYWPAIVALFVENKAVVAVKGGEIVLTHGTNLYPVYEDCKNIIKEMEKAEHDRNLRNKESEENIKYGRKGYELSKIAIWLSAIAILVEIVRGLLDLLL